MKKLFMAGCLLLSSFSVLTAQDDCMQFFPNTEGAVMISSTYDANNNLMSTMNYRIDHVYDYQSGTDMQISFTMTDKDGKAIDRGTLDGNCMNGNFYLSMTNRGVASEIIKNLSMNTELVGDFLDYPNMYDDTFPFDSPFEMDGGEFTIRSKSNKDEWVKVRVINRQYEKNEDITTPARTEPFRAAKVTFNFELTTKGNTTRYKGVEWYSPNAGIVRTETYDDNNNLLSYTVLTTLRDK